MPALKHTPGCSVWVAVEHLCLTDISAVACSQCMFCQCRSSYGAIPEGSPMFLSPVIKGSSSKLNVHLWAFCAEIGVGYFLSLIHWHSVFRVNKKLAKVITGQNTTWMSSAWCEDFSDSYQEIADVRQGRGGFRSPFLSVRPWSAQPRVLVDKAGLVAIPLQCSSYVLLFLHLFHT